MKWFEDERIRGIVDYVRWRRERDGVRIAPGRKFEMSGEMFGEFRNLLEVQLLTTPEFADAWLELKKHDDRPDDAIIAGVLREIALDLRRRRDEGQATFDAEALLSRIMVLAESQPMPTHQ